MIEGGCPVRASAVYLGEAVIRGRAPCCVPRAFIEGVVSFIWTFLIGECQAKGVVWLAVWRIGVAQGEAGDGSQDMFLGKREFTAIQMPAAHGKVGAAVAGVALEGLAPVDLWRAGGVAILLKMKAIQKKFVVAGHFLG